MAYRGPLAYNGIAQPTPPNQVVLLRAPTTNDYVGFNIGDRWIVPYQATGPSEQEWVLMSKAQGIATWVQINAGSAVTYTDHELLVGTGTPTIDSIPHGTSGQPLISGGAGADPGFNDLTVPFGGTSASSFVAYTPVCGGTSSTGALQSVASIGNIGDILTSQGAGALPQFAPIGSITPITVPNGGTGDDSIAAYEVVCGGVTDVDALQTVGSLGTSGQVLTSQGAGKLPHWVDNSATSGFNTINVQTFTTSGTYTPTAGMLFCEVECLGGGGGGGGAASNSGGGAYTGAGAGAGGYCKANLTATDIGASQAVTIGAGGAGGSGNATGSTGSNTTFGSILTGNGGVGGASGGSLSATYTIIGAVGGTASGGDSNVQGQYGGNGQNFSASPPGVACLSGNGANSLYGVGGVGIWYGAGAANGNAGIGYGSGGGGAVSANGGASKTGGTGSSGLIIVTEYISS